VRPSDNSQFGKVARRGPLGGSPGRVMAAAADAAEPFAVPLEAVPVEEAAPPAAAAVATKCPLPYNYRQGSVDGSYDKLGYSNTATAKEWRKPTERITTVYERPEADHLFGAGQLAHLSKNPDDLLNPPPLSKEEKKAKRVSLTRLRPSVGLPLATRGESWRRSRSGWTSLRTLARSTAARSQCASLARHMVMALLSSSCAPFARDIQP
jgi:hypothetical protein